MILKEDGIYSVNDGTEKKVVDFNDGYYHFYKDYYNYSKKGVYSFIVYSMRGPGKTYSCLYESILLKNKILFLKRSNADIDMLCNDDVDGSDFDSSPWAPICRDHPELNIKVKKLSNGFAMAYFADDEGNSMGNDSIIAYCCSLHAIKDLKGYSIDVDVVLFDEFIPLPGQRCDKNESDQVLSCYMTALRDKIRRGRNPMPLVLFSNSEQLSCRLTVGLEVIDDIYMLQCSGRSHIINEKRGLMIHHILPEEINQKDNESVNSPIGKLMAGTKWYDRNFSGLFTEDMSMVKDIPTKNFKIIVKLKKESRTLYILEREKDGIIYFTDNIKGLKLPKESIPEYDFNFENDCKSFYTSKLLRNIERKFMNKQCYFQKYSYYDMIKNFGKIYI